MAQKKSKKKVSRKNKLKFKNFIKKTDKDKLIDRDESLLMFQDRVLQQADDISLPLLERLRFISIFHSNVDDFFIKRMWLSRHYILVDDSHEAKLKHENIRNKVIELYAKACNIYKKLKPELSKNHISILDWSELTTSEKNNLKKLFMEKIFPVLTPLSVDQGHPFPYISSFSTSLAVSLRYPKAKELMFSRLKIPDFFPAFYCLQSTDDKKYRWVRTEDIIQQNLDTLFPKMEIVDSMLFRVARNIEVESDEDKSESLMEKIENELRSRKYGEIVKLEYKPSKDTWLLNFLKAELEIYDFDIYKMDGELDYTRLETIINMPLPKLKFKPWVPVINKEFSEDKSIFQSIKDKDILVHHPYESFNHSVENLIWSSANDSKVIAIKMTFYRTNEESSIIQALITAAENGKEVVVLIELQASMDEERNISWANKLERAGCHVVYGVIGLKTHCKVALVVRKEQESFNCYAHIGSGNYNATTAKLYTDVGLLTCNKKITFELTGLFHFLTGRSLKDDYKYILKAPLNLKKNFLKLISNEIDHVQNGKKGEIIFKCNNLEDKDICTALYSASRAGVKVSLIIRSICSLIPGRKDLSENIKVYSIVDRFLEHSRIFYFRNGAKEREEGLMYQGSSDLMYRNLERRVEVLTPFLSAGLVEQGLFILDSYLTQDSQTWELNKNGTYDRKKSKGKSTQEFLMDYYKLKNKPSL